MNKEYKHRLCQALRSGDYKQGRGYLRIDDKYCCLGVLCDLYDPNKWTVHENSPYRLVVDTQTYPILYKYDNYSLSMIHSKLMEYAGLSLDACIKLARLNDKDGLSFDEIADYIDEKL